MQSEEEEYAATTVFQKVTLERRILYFGTQLYS